LRSKQLNAVQCPRLQTGLEADEHIQKKTQVLNRTLIADVFVLLKFGTRRRFDFAIDRFDAAPFVRLYYLNWR
jgi:hypothetical protein